MNIPKLEQKRFNFQGYVAKRPWKKGDMFFAHFSDLEEVNRRYDSLTVIICHKDKNQVYYYTDSRVVKPNSLDKGIMKIQKRIKTSIKNNLKFVRSFWPSGIIPNEIKVFQENLILNSYQNFCSQKPVCLQFMR